MRKILSLSLPLALFLAACGNKDDDPKPAGDALSGTYEYVSIYVKGTSESTMTDPDFPDLKMITNMEYTTIENKGTCVFENGKMTSTNLSYKVSSNFVVESFSDGVSDGEPVSRPFNWTAPNTNAVSTYKLIGTDSVYFDQGTTFFPSTNPQTGATETPSIPTKAKFTSANGELVLTSRHNLFSSETESGITITNRHNVLTITKLKKK